VTIADNRPALARVGSDGTVNVTGSFDVGVPFFVMGRGAAMDQDADPGGGPFLRRPRTLCSASSETAGLDAKQPLPFLVTGQEDVIEFYILNRIGDPPHNMEEHKKIQLVF
jgi:hypothetical protein